MKKKSNNNWEGIVIALALFLGTTALAAPGDPISALLHRGAGEQITTEITLGASVPTSALLDANEPGKDATFEGTDSATPPQVVVDATNQSFLSVLTNAWFQDKVFVGRNNSPFKYNIPHPSNPLSTLEITITDTQASSNLPVWVDAIEPGGVTADIQKLNIFGGVLSTDLNTASGNSTGQGQVCINGAGELILCP